MATEPKNQSELSPLKRAFVALEKAEAELTQLKANRSEPIAVVGMACRFPGGADSLEGYWKLLTEGRDAVNEIPKDRWDVDAYYEAGTSRPGKMYTRAGAFLDQIHNFDPQFFNISPREAELLDPQHRLLLQVTWEALEHAGQAANELAETRTGVFVGICKSEHMQLVRDQGSDQCDGYFASGGATSMAAGRISYLLGLEGPSLSIDTACSSSLVALHTACQSLRNKECETALVGGVNLILSPHNTISFCAAGMMSHSGKCRTFSEGADGFVQGEGCGVIVLRRLSDAISRGDRILADVRGSAINHDGASSSLTAPSGPSQQRVIKSALDQSGLSPHDIQYIEAHGTGTSLGDPIEVQALGAVYGQNRDKSKPLLLGAVKSQIGHLEAAAGIAGFIKLVLCLQHGRVPGQLHCDHLNPHIDWQRWPLQVAKQYSAWPAETNQLRIGAVSSFGFSGTNAHIIVSQQASSEANSQASAEPLARSRNKPETDRSWHLLPLSAPDDNGLQRLATQYEAFLETAESPIADICFAASSGRAHHRHRLAIVGHETAGMQAAIAAWLLGQSSSYVLQQNLSETEVKQVAFAFTGQGAQYPEMCRSLYISEPTFRRVLDQCLSILEPILEVSPRTILLDCAAEAVNMTELIDSTDYAQPLLFSVEYALAELLMSWGIQPTLVLGHSLGQYVAACIAGVFSLEDGLRIVAARGRLMHTLTQSGAMLAVMESAELLSDLIADYKDSVSIAAVNGEKNTVISGSPGKIDAIVAMLAQRHIASVKLNAMRGFHSPLIEPALEPFAEILRSVSLSPPRIPLVCNITGQVLDPEQAVSIAYWLDHARLPVQFHRMLQRLAKSDCHLVIELGPTPILTGMAAKDPSHKLDWIPTLRKQHSDEEMIQLAVADIYVHGVPIDWQAFYSGQNVHRTDLPSYPFAKEHYPYPLGYRGYEQKTLSTPPCRSDHRPADYHPLLGNLISSPLADLTYETWLDVNELSFAADHCVGSTTIMPAAGFLAMAYAAASRYWQSNSIVLRDVSIATALALHPDRPTRVQLIMQVESNQLTSFRIDSFQGSSEDNGRWICHVQGKTESLTRPPASKKESWEVIQGLIRRSDSIAESASFYESLRQSGLNFGPALCGVQEVWQVGVACAVGKICFNSLVEMPCTEETVDPASLDACLQVLAATSPDFLVNPRPLRVPIAIKEVYFFGSLHQPTTDPLWSLVEETSPGEDDTCVIESQIDVFNSDGKQQIALRELLLSPYQAGGYLTPAEQNNALDSLFYHVQWEHLALNPSQSSLRADSQKTLAQKLADHRDCLESLDRLAPATIIQAMQKLGGSFRLGSTLTPLEVASELHICEAEVKLIPRLMEILSTAGISSYLNAAAIKQVDHFSHINLVDALNELEMRYPASHAEINLFRRCATSFAAALRGEMDPLDLLFPGGSLELAESFYHRSPSAVYYNSALAHVASTWIAQSRLDRPVRILEVGAGTGGTTIALLSQLTKQNLDFEYTFTDVSPAFVSRAKNRFGDYEQVRFATFDLELSAEEQSLPLGDFDLIIAANCVHATQSIKQAVCTLKSLLTPEGALLLTEITTKRPWIDLTFGLTDGWWRFCDNELRSDYPLLSTEDWKVLLSQFGWEVMTSAGEITTEESSVDAGQVVILASPTPMEYQIHLDEDLITVEPVHQSPNWLILSNDSARAKELAEQLEQNGQQSVIIIDQQAASTLSAKNKLSFDFRKADKLTDLLSPYLETSLTGIACLWTVPTSVSGHTEQMPTQVTLQVIQDLIRHAGQFPPRLWIVTRGAVPANNLDSIPTPEQATLWGLGKVVRLEHPELHCTCLDLDPNEARIDVTQLILEFTSNSSEREIAWRNGYRFVPRLVPGQEESPTVKQLENEEDFSYTVSPTQRGDFDHIEILAQARKFPGPGEVEIHVEATGLNFRDVLNVLGLYPGAPPLGAECVGVVSRLGKGVNHLKPGERVIAIASASLASHVIVDARFVVPKPSALTLSEASAAAIPLVTAAFSLFEVANLQAGERVLIHAAAGGVGLAAVQLAQQRGAEIIATAGSPEKRVYLESLGVKHVFDSRTTAFADQISKLTDGQGVAVVLNSLSGEAMKKSLDILSHGGRFVELGKREILSSEEVNFIRPDVLHTAVDWGETAQSDPERISALFQELMRQLGEKILAPLPTTAYRLNDAAEAFRFMAAGRHIGRLSLVHPHATNRSGTNLHANATYLITGGLGGLGFSIARDFVRRGVSRIILAGRRTPTEEQQTEIDEWRNGGVEIQIFEGDVSQREEVQYLIELSHASERPLRGVIHAAGTLQDGVLSQQSWSNFDAVFAAKVNGTKYLHEFTQTIPLDFFLLFSSIASVLGSPGQANHSAANAYMDALAHHRKARGLPGTSINWGIWSDTGAAARRGIDTDGQRRGLLPFPPVRGIQALHHIFRHPTSQVSVMSADWPVLLPQRPRTELDTFLKYFVKDAADQQNIKNSNLTIKSSNTPAHGQDDTTEVRRATPQRRRLILQESVEQLIRKLLRLNGDHSLEMSVPLREYGLDSLMAVEMRNILSQKFDCGLPSTLLFEAPTISALVEFLDTQIGSNVSPSSEAALSSVIEAPVKARTSPRSSVDSLLDEIEGLSDDDVDKIMTAPTAKRHHHE